MIILVDDRVEVTDAYRASFSREGISAASFTPTDFDNWFHSTSGPDLAAVEAFILGDFLQREMVTRAIKTRSEAPAIALNDSIGLESTLKLFAAGADDVVRKPVHAREIIARISAIRRRTSPRSKATDLGDLRVFNDGRDPMHIDPGSRREDLQGDIKRLKRLAAAQTELTRLVELRVGLEGTHLKGLRTTLIESILAADRLSVAGLASSPEVTRKLVTLNIAIQLSERRLAELGRDLMKASVRQESLRDRVEDAAYGELRKKVDEQTQEAALSGANARHKGGVLR